MFVVCSACHRWLLMHMNYHNFHSLPLDALHNEVYNKLHFHHLLLLPHFYTYKKTYKNSLTWPKIKSVSLNVSMLNSNGLNCSGFDTLDSDVVSILIEPSGYSLLTTTISIGSPPLFCCCVSGGRFFECDFFMCLTRWSFLPKRCGQNWHRKSRIPVCTTKWRRTSFFVKNLRSQCSQVNFFSLGFFTVLKNCCSKKLKIEFILSLKNDMAKLYSARKNYVIARTILKNWKCSKYIFIRNFI